MGFKKRVVGAAVILLGLFLFSNIPESRAQSSSVLDLTKVRDRIRGTGFITSKPLPSWGSIVGTKDTAVHLTEGEVVYLRLWAGKAATVGDRFTIMHVGDPVSHPLTRKALGNMVTISGELVVLEVTGDVVLGKIHKSNRAIYVGDQIAPPSAPIAETIPVRISANRIEGIVIAPVEEEENITQKELIFIDRGSRDGVIVGDLFTIYRSGLKERGKDYGLETRKMGGESLPNIKVGEAVVVSFQEETSTALVTHSSESIYVGDRVVSGRK